MNRGHADVLLGNDGFQRAHQTQHAVFCGSILRRIGDANPGSCIGLVANPFLGAESKLHTY
jgi:hypothetical protein